MATSQKTQQFVLLPVRGLRAAVRTRSDDTRNFLIDAASQVVSDSQKMGVAGFAGAMVKSVSDPGINLRVIDSIHEDGAELVELTPQEALTLRERQPGLKLVPVVYFYQQVQRKKIEAKAADAAATKIRLTLVSKADGQPVAGAKVVAFTDFANRIGLSGTTDNSGIVDLAFGTMTKKLD